MKKLNKKGFTIVELVIVIAVIAILAAVLIPTFSGVVSKANESAAIQEARTSLTNVLSGNTSGSLNNAVFAINNGGTYIIEYDNQKLDEDGVQFSGATNAEKNDVDKFAGNLTAASSAKAYNSTNEYTLSEYSIIVKAQTLTEKEKNVIAAALGVADPTIAWNSWKTAATNGNDIAVLSVVKGEAKYYFTVYVNSDLSGNCAVFIK